MNNLNNTNKIIKIQDNYQNDYDMKNNSEKDFSYLPNGNEDFQNKKNNFSYNINGNSEIEDLNHNNYKYRRFKKEKDFENYESIKNSKLQTDNIHIYRRKPKI